VNARDTICSELTIAIAEQAIRVGYDAGTRVWGSHAKMPELAISIKTALASHLANTTYNIYWRAGFAAGFLGISIPTPAEVDRVTPIAINLPASPV
jgi:hypothetical protein